MGVDLGGCEMLVAQEFLDSPEVAARFQEVTSAGVPEEMRVKPGTDAFPDPVSGEPCLDGPGGDPGSPCAHKERSLLWVPGRAHAEPGRQGLKCRGTDRNDSLPVAFSTNPNQSRFCIEVCHVQSHEFRETEGGGIEELEYGPIEVVADCPRGLGEEAAHPVHIQNDRQTTPVFGRSNQKCRIMGGQPLSDEVPVQAPHRGKITGQCAGRGPGPGPGRQPTAQGIRLECLPPSDPFSGQETSQAVETLPVGLNRGSREPAGLSEFIEESVDCGFEVRIHEVERPSAVERSSPKR